MRALRFLVNWGGWIGTGLLIIWLAVNRYLILATIGIWLMIGMFLVAMCIARKVR